MDIFPQLIVNSLIATALYSLVALSFSLLFSTNKFFDLSFGGILLVGGYGTLFILEKTSLPLFVGIIISTCVSVLLGILLYSKIYLPLRARKSKNLVLLIATLGVYIVIEALISIIFTSKFQTFSPFIQEARTFTVLGGTFTSIHLITFILAILSSVFIFLFIKKTRTGKAISAVIDDKEVAEVTGIPTKRIILVVVAIACVIGGWAGLLSGLDTGLLPLIGMRLLLKGIVAGVIGGVGTIWGPLAGATLLGFSENLGIAFIPGEWKDAIAFGLLIIFLIFKPKGIFQK